MQKVFVGEAIVSRSGTLAMVTRVGLDSIEAIHFQQDDLSIGEDIAGTGEKLSVSVGEKMAGHIFDALGYTYGGKEDSRNSENRPVDTGVTNIEGRSMIGSQLETGITLVDTLVPIAKGQRELILGDKGTGKTSLAIQILANHIRSGGIGILCMIGKQRTEITKAVEYLLKSKTKDGCVIIAEPADSVASRIFVAPFTAMTVAEFYRDLGKDVLIVMDDLSIHANRHRELSLFADNFPGRESYPSDIFWTHARLVERAGAFKNKEGKKSTITCLPIIETIDGNYAGYIETNLMSMTDGHILLDKELITQGQYPAINHSLSVTRVGRQTQPNLGRLAGQAVMELIKDFDNLKNFLRFGYDLNENAERIIRIMGRLKITINQSPDEWHSFSDQIKLLGGVWTGNEVLTASGSKNFQTWEEYVSWCMNSHDK